MHVVQVIDSLVPGGAERSLAATAPHLVAAGVRLDVVSLGTTEGLAGELRAAGCDVTMLGTTGRRQAHAALLDVIRRRRPELVHTTLFEADLAGRTAARRAGVPVVTTLANEAYGPEQRAALPGWRLRAAQLVDAATARLAVRFHAVSAAVASTMARRLWVPLDRIDVVHRGRDAAALGRRTPERRQAVRQALGIGAGDHVVLAVGRHERQKGFDVLMDAVSRLGIDGGAPPMHVLVAGREGTATTALRAAAERLGIAATVDLLGRRDDVADLLCAADVFVLSSRWEGLPGALVEAMALEAPVVATAIPPVHEVLGDGELAVVVPVGDAAALAAGITESLSDRVAASRRARAARERFDVAFRIEAVAGAMVEFYERAMRAAER